MNPDDNNSEISYEGFVGEMRHLEAGRRILSELYVLRHSERHLLGLVRENYERWQKALSDSEHYKSVMETAVTVSDFAEIKSMLWSVLSHTKNKPKVGYMGDVNGAGCDPDVP